MTRVQWVAIMALMIAYGLAMFVMGAVITSGSEWFSIAFVVLFGLMGALIVRTARVQWATNQQQPGERPEGVQG